MDIDVAGHGHPTLLDPGGLAAGKSSEQITQIGCGSLLLLPLRPSSRISNKVCHEAWWPARTRSTSSGPDASSAAAVRSRRSSVTCSRSVSPRANHFATRARNPAQTSLPAACTTAVPPAAANAVNVSASTPPPPQGSSYVTVPPDHFTGEVSSPLLAIRV